MKYLFGLCLFSNLVFASVNQADWYPEERNYTSTDNKMAPYLAKSLYGTNTFALTFDDGPDVVRTPKLLDVLAKHEVKATFFVLSQNLTEASFPIIKRALDEGHIVASHGPDHARSTDQTELVWKTAFQGALLKLADFYHRAGYEFSNIYYRFPYGAYGGRKDYNHLNVIRELSKALMGDNCIQFAFWDVDTADWVPGMTSAEVAQNIIANNEGGTGIDFTPVKVNGKITYRKVPYQIKNPIGGGVVLEHDIHDLTANAVDLFLTYAKEKGVKIVRLDEVEEFKVLRHCSL